MCKQPLLHNFLWLSPVESSLVMFKLSIWRLFLQPSESTAAQQQQYDGTTHLVFTWRDLLEKKGPVLYIQIHRRIDWDHHRRHIEIWFWNKNPDELARQQKQQQHSQLILRSPPEQEHSPQVIIIMATIIIIKIICAFWMCIVVCLCSLCWNVN